MSASSRKRLSPLFAWIVGLVIVLALLISSLPLLLRVVATHTLQEQLNLQLELTDISLNLFTGAVQLAGEREVRAQTGGKRPVRACVHVNGHKGTRWRAWRTAG